MYSGSCALADTAEGVKFQLNGSAPTDLRGCGLCRSNVWARNTALTALWTPSILNDGKKGTWGLGGRIFARPKHTSHVPFGVLKLLLRRIRKTMSQLSS